MCCSECTWIDKNFGYNHSRQCFCLDMLKFFFFKKLQYIYLSPPPPPPPPPPPFFPTFPHFFPSIRISIYLHCPPSVSFYPLVYIISLCSRLWAPLSGLRRSSSSSTGTQHSSTPLRRNNVQAPLKHSPTLHRHRHSWPTLGLFTRRHKRSE